MERSNVIVLGCGRNGTSMVAGSIARKGYSVGGEAHKSNPANPKGFFETNLVNRINNELLWKTPGIETTQGIPQGWLTSLPITQEIGLPSETILLDMKEATKLKPFCIKDPRMSYTLSAWRTVLENVKVICMFRHPGEFLNSLITHCKTQEYLKDIVIDEEFFQNIWLSMYNYIISNHVKNHDILFVNYDQVLFDDGLDKISEFIGCEIDRTFPEKELKRSKRLREVRPELIELYDRLLCLANYPKGRT